MKAVFLIVFCVLYSCGEIRPAVVKDYAPAEISFHDTSAPQILTVGKCTTFIERNNSTQTTVVRTTSAPDTFYKETMQNAREAEKRPFWWEGNFVLPALLVLSVLFIMELLFKFMRFFKNQKQ